MIEQKTTENIVFKNNLFLLNTKNTSYSFGRTESGYTGHIHWGGRITVEDLPRPEDIYREYQRFSRPARVEVLGQEYPGWGGEFFGEPALKVTFQDQIRCTCLKYHSHKIESDRLTVTLKDVHYPLFADLCYRIYPEYDILERSSIIRNEGTKNVVLESVLSAAWYFPHTPAARLTHLSGRWGCEHIVNRTFMTHMKILLESRTGLSGPFCEPYFSIDDGTATEESGEVYWAALQWSGNWKIAIERDSEGRVSATGGINDFDTAIPLSPGESFTTPVFTAGFTKSGFGGAARQLHDFQRDCVMPQKIMKKTMPLLFNSWGSMGIDVSEEKIIAVAEKAASIGVELFVIDDGWQAALGDWFPDPAKFPTGLKPVVDKVAKLGMKFGLWVEIESFEINSILYHEHPEWALRFEAVDPYFSLRGDLGRISVLLNLARPEVAEYLYNVLQKLIMETGISYLKLDLNALWSNPGWESVPDSRKKTIWIEYVRNLHSIFERLNREFPEVMFENCAAGSGRPDLGMMHFFSRINRSDNQDTLDILTMHEGFTCVHPSRSAGGACHISDNCGGNNGHSFPLQFQAFTGMTGSLAIACNLMKSPPEMMERLLGYAELYKKIRHIPQFGDMYRIMSISNSNAAVFEFVSKDKDEALVFVLERNVQFCKISLHCRLRGLDPESVYSLTVYGQKENLRIPTPQRSTGNALMSIGVNIPVFGDFDSRILHYRKIR